MRLFLLPVSTRQSLIYCAKAVEQLPLGAKPKPADKIGRKIAAQWAAWEKKSSGFQKQVTVYGSKLLRRIPYKEWALKSLPPATAKQLQSLENEKPQVECLYPARLLDAAGVHTALKQLAVERQSFHRRRMWQTAAIAPFMLPFAFVPMMNKLVLGYMAFRTWSHYRALYGGKYLEALLSRNRITPVASQEMDAIYATGVSVSGSDERLEPQTDNEEALLLEKSDAKHIAKVFALPDLEVGITRAIDQVELMVHGGAKREGVATDGNATDGNATAEATLSPPAVKL